MRLARYEQCTKKYFIGLTHFLGNVLGPKYEVVFHSLIRIRLIWKPLRIAMLADGPFPLHLVLFGSSLFAG